MTRQDNGGPAFPVPWETPNNGMTLRDWFAGQAPEVPDWWMGEGCPTPPPGWNQGDGATAWDQACHRGYMRRIALWRFAYADAMLEARAALAPAAEAAPTGERA